jgi:hypothetical protein
LKKASPDPPPTPNHHLDGLTYFTDDRPALRQSTGTCSLHENGKMTLLKMLVFNPLP